MTATKRDATGAQLDDTTPLRDEDIAAAASIRQAAAPVWGSWKTHGNNSALIYFGKDRTAGPLGGRRVVVGQTNLGWQMLDSDTGEKVMWGGYATRFWATPDMSAPVNQDEQIAIALAPCTVCDAPEGHEDWCEMADEPQADAYPTEDGHAKLVGDGEVRVQMLTHPCRCGCLRFTKNMYAQGHDAKHVSKVVARIKADKDITVSSAIAELPTDALRTKAANAIARYLGK